MDLKKSYPIHLRIGFLSVIVCFILAFLLVPRHEIKVSLPDLPPPVTILSPDQIIENIIEPPSTSKPPLPVEAKSDAEVEQSTIGRTDIFTQESDEIIEEYVFVPHTKDPVPLNLEQVRKDLEYPEVAAKLGIEGRVFVLVFVDREGRVRKAKIAKGVHPLLNEAALKAAMKLRFSPAYQRDKPVAVWATVYFDFILTQ